MSCPAGFVPNIAFFCYVDFKFIYFPEYKTAADYLECAAQAVVVLLWTPASTQYISTSALIGEHRK